MLLRIAKRQSATFSHPFQAFDYDEHKRLISADRRCRRLRRIKQDEIDQLPLNCAWLIVTNQPSTVNCLNGFHVTIRSRLEKRRGLEDLLVTYSVVPAPSRRFIRVLPASAIGLLTRWRGGDVSSCRVGPGNFTPSPSQIRT